MKYKHRYLILIAGLLWLNGTGQGLPDLQWKSLDWHDGLPEYTFEASMIQDRLGRLWIGSDRGLFRYDGYTLTSFQANPNDPSSLPEMNIRALFEDDMGKIWVSMRNAGIAIYDPVTNTFDRRMPAELGGNLPATRIWNITADRDKNLWIGSDEGLLKYNSEADSFSFYTSDFSHLGTNAKAYYNAVRRIVQHPYEPNTLFIATRGGLAEFDRTSESFTYIPMPYSSKDELGLDSPHYLIIDLCLAQDTLLWCATWAGGLMVYHIKTGKWQRFQNPNCAPEDDIGFAIHIKSDHELWYANRQGFAVFDMKAGESKYFHPAPDAPNSIISGPIHDVIVLRDSTLVVAGSTGVSICYDCPWSLDRTDDVPYLSEIQLNGETLTMDTSITHVNSLSLEPGENNLVFTVGYPALLHPEAIRFRYKLDGHDANWLETGTRVVEYQKLSGGNYTFRYQVSKDGQQWRDGLTSPTIHIAQVFWRHPLFISSCLLLFLLSIFSWHRIRIHRLNKQQALETQFNQKLAAMEMSVLRAQMNPHFMFNSLNSIKNYILKKKTEEASSYLTKFSQLMRAVLQNSQSTLIPLHEEMKALSLYIELEALRFEGEFEWKIMVDPSLHSEALAVPPLLIQPYVENAIRHGLLEKESGSRELSILIAPLKTDILSITIQDNGIGRTHSARRQQHVRRNRSYGMQITSDRIALIMKTLGILATVHVEDLYHTDGSPAGTKVEIQIPQLSATKDNGLSQDTVIHSNYAEDDIDR